VLFLKNFISFLLKELFYSIFWNRCWLCNQTIWTGFNSTITRLLFLSNIFIFNYYQLSYNNQLADHNRSRIQFPYINHLWNFFLGPSYSVGGRRWIISVLCEYPSLFYPKTFDAFGFFVSFKPSLFYKYWILFSIYYFETAPIYAFYDYP